MADNIRKSDLVTKLQAQIEWLKEHLLKAGEQEIRLHAEIERLRLALMHILLSRDVTWDKRGGHDFGIAVQQAQAALKPEGE